MTILITSIFIFASLIVLTSFLNLKLSIALYISYLILVPYLQFNIGGLSFSYNLVNTILLAVFLYQHKVKKQLNLDFKVVGPFLFLYICLLTLAFFTDDTPWDIQLNYWRASFMQTIILPFIIWNIAKADSKMLYYFTWSITISIAIAGLYGLMLTQWGGINPYTSLLANYFKANDVAEVYMPSASRIAISTASKIQSTMAHPMTWGLYLCFTFVVFLAMYMKSKNLRYLFLLPFVGLNILLSGARTGIAALVIGAAYYLLRQRELKTLFLGLFLFVTLGMVIQSNDDLSNIFASFTDISGTKSDIHGSTISMRMDQLQGVFNELKGCELAGKGYGWNGYYISKHGDHPVILAFESLIFVILCNSGYIGMCVWIVFFVLLFRLQRIILNNKDDIYLMDTLVITYLAYAIGTGEYGYLNSFSLFYTFLLAFLRNNFKLETIYVKQMVIKRLVQLNKINRLQPDKKNRFK